MSIKSKLALVAALTTLIAAPAFAADQQASTEAALDRAPAQVGIQSGAYASAERTPRATHVVRPSVQTQTQTEDFQAVGTR